MDRFTETFGIMRYEPEIGSLTAQKALGLLMLDSVSYYSLYVKSRKTPLQTGVCKGVLFGKKTF